MPQRPTLRLLQLPIPQPAQPSATANVPLAAGCLAVAASASGLRERLEVEVVPQDQSDQLGDALLADAVAEGEPEFVGLSLYLWNVERSLHLAREVKRRSPRTRILVGGPEVNPDNPFVLSADGWDVAVVGEAEELFGTLLAELLEGRDAAAVPGAAVRQSVGAPRYTPAPAAGFALSRFPSPYLERILPVEPHRSTYVETVRGCKSHCTFCFYPRSSATLRSLDVAESVRLLEGLRDLGAREVVFLDPTFNHRPEFEALLVAIRQVNADRGLRFFAEVRAEGLTEKHADLLAKAGFHKLEIGLQSINERTLATTRRGGKPALVASASRMLKARGIDLLVDLIVGLPGDTREDVLGGVDFLHEHGLAEEAQVFPLSVLAGTQMRATAAADGLVFDPFPPYRVRHTREMREEEILETFLEAERRLSRTLDEFPRPRLVDPHDAQARDVFRVNVDDSGEAELRIASAPAASHVALWIEGFDLWGKREWIARALGMRMKVDPFCILDVVLVPSERFPLDLIPWLRRRLDEGPQCYAARVLSHRGEDAKRRLSVVMKAGMHWPADYVSLLLERVSLFRDQPMLEALRDAARLGDDLPGARIVEGNGATEQRDFERLAQLADPEAVVFADRALEARWVEEVIRYKDVGE